MKSRTLFIATLLAIVSLVAPLDALAQRRGGSFGGGGRSFGGGGTRSFSGGGSPRSSSSFNRGGSFGGSRTQTRSSSSTGSPFRPTAPPIVRNTNPGYTQHNTYINYGGYGRGYYHTYGGWGDYSYGWVHPAWYFWTPFHPAFYYNPPIYQNGYYEPGGFSFFKLMLGMVLVFFFVWLIWRIFVPRQTVIYTQPGPPDVW